MSRAMARAPSPWALPFLDIGGDIYHGARPRRPGPSFASLSADYAAIEVRMMAALGALMVVCPVCGEKVWGMGDYLGRGRPTEDSLMLSHALRKGDPAHGVLYVMSA